MSSGLSELINHKIGNGKLSWLRKMYLSVSSYEIKYFNNIDTVCETLFIYSEELRPRPEFENLLLNIVDKVKNSKLIVFKRKIKFIYNSSVEDQIISTINQINLENIKYIVIFCPHLMIDHAFLLRAKSAAIATICMQHGYYSFTSEEFEFFKKLTVCDIALQYDHKTDIFFSNCKKRFYVGQYAITSTINPKVIGGTMIYLPYVNKTNSSYVAEMVEFINKKSDAKCTIRLHPRQTKNELRKIFPYNIGSLRIRNLPKNNVGDVNYYIETTAWAAIKFTINDDVNNFLIRNGIITKITAESYPSVDKVVFTLNKIIKNQIV